MITIFRGLGVVVVSKYFEDNSCSVNIFGFYGFICIKYKYSENSYSFYTTRVSYGA